MIIIKISLLVKGSTKFENKRICQLVIGKEGKRKRKLEPSSSSCTSRALCWMTDLNDDSYLVKNNLNEDLRKT